MEGDGQQPEKRGWRKYSPYLLPALIIFGAGVIFSGAFASFVQYTNTMDFCISCHEMRDTVYQEYKKSPHYVTRSGIRPSCADCHVPSDNWISTVSHKVVATKELVLHLAGYVDTPEKFEAVRPELAKRIWAKMKANDSATCRTCHHTDNWDLSLHRPRARAQHEDMKKSGETCIDCHKGIAHKPVQEEAPAPSAEEESFTL